MTRRRRLRPLSGLESSRQARFAAALAIGLGFTAMFASAPGQSFVIAVFVDDMIADTGVSRTLFSALYAAGTIFSALIAMSVGRFSDRAGLRIAWILVVIVLAVGCLLASVASGALLLFIALSLLRSFGQGAFALVGSLIVARSFGDARGRAMSIALFGLTAAGMILPPVLTVTIMEIGWRDTYQVIAGVLLVLIVPMGLLISATRAAPRADEAADDDGESFPPSMRRSVRLRGLEVPTRDAGLLLVVFAVPGLVVTALTFHAVSLLERNGLDATEAAIALTALAAASAVGTLGGGFIADRTSTRALLTLMTVTLTGGTVLLLGTSAATAYVAFVVLGLSIGVFSVANSTVWARTYGLHRLGRIQGLGYAAMISGAAIGPLPLAASLALFDTYVPGIVALAVTGAIAFAAAVWRHEPEQTSQPAPSGS